MTIICKSGKLATYISADSHAEGIAEGRHLQALGVSPIVSIVTVGGPVSRADTFFPSGWHVTTKKINKM